jgi:hypothetical protein
VDAAHQGADEPLDMGAKTGSRDRPVKQLDAVFSAAAGERFAVKFRPIVNEDSLG